jgi:hypothetical protein
MAFTPLDLPIQEMLQTDFITDLATIHNSNVLLLKDKLEDIVNNFEIDTNGITIGTGNPISNISSQDVIIQDGGFVFQTGIPNQIIAKLNKNGSDESVLNVDHLTVDIDIATDSLNVNDITVNNSMTIGGPATYIESLQYNSSLVTSKENVAVTLLKVLDTAVGTITLTNTSKTNIYVTLEAETAALGQVWNGSSFTGTLTDIILSIDFDASNPPAANTIFTIHIVDVIENSASVSLITNNAINSHTPAPPPVQIAAGTNQATTLPIIMHHDLVTEGQKLAINHGASAMFQSQAILKYGHNASFNYIIDQDTNDRLIITSAIGLEIY